MTVVAVIGDCTTTTSVALASSWSASDDVVVIEADRSGGSLAGWLDTPPVPSLSTVVTHTRGFDVSAEAAWAALNPLIHRAASGVRFIAAPVRSREASRAIDEASRTVFPVLADLSGPVLLADCGRLLPADPLPHLVSVASAVVVVHRQSNASAAAAAVRLERLAESVHELLALGCPIELAIIGDRPFDLDEIGRFVADGEHHSTTGRTTTEQSITVHALADDALSAAVVAGRSGVSTRRLVRLPLFRTSRDLADALRRRVGHDAAEADADSDLSNDRDSVVNSVVNSVAGSVAGNIAGSIASSEVDRAGEVDERDAGAAPDVRLDQLGAER